jgi:shikimate kinase
MRTFEAMRVYLIGYMGSGKSRTGGEVASLLKWRFIDMDDLFEERYRISVLDFFEKYDEISFRNIERKLLHETVLEKDAIIATGGGTACFFDNMDFINGQGTSIYLKPAFSLLANRLKIVRKKRPLLKDLKLENFTDYIRKQIDEREKFYTKAHFTLEGPDISPEKVICIVETKQNE